MGHIVVTQPKGDKHVLSSETKEFWDTYNARTLPDFHVKITEFDGEDSEKKATEYALTKTPDHTPIDTNNLKKVEAKIREKAETDAQAKIDAAAKEADLKLKEQEEKMKKLQEKIAELEATKESKKNK